MFLSADNIGHPWFHWRIFFLYMCQEISKMRTLVKIQVLNFRTIFGGLFFRVYLRLSLKWSHRQEIKALPLFYAFDLSPSAMSPVLVLWR